MCGGQRKTKVPGSIVRITPGCSSVACPTDATSCVSHPSQCPTLWGYTCLYSCGGRRTPRSTSARCSILTLRACTSASESPAWHLATHARCTSATCSYTTRWALEKRPFTGHVLLTSEHAPHTCSTLCTVLARNFEEL